MIKDKSIFIKNIYYMLSYAFSVLKQKDYENISVELFDNIHNLFAAILEKGIGRQLRLGLYKEYLFKKENISTVRGKIDISGTIHNIMNKRQEISCQYDELSENNILNQILKTTTLLLLHHKKVDEKYKKELKNEMLFFSNVEVIDLLSIKWSMIKFQRNNSNYYMLISICKLIIDGMLLTTETGKHKLASFIDESQMYHLYEKFILEYYKQEFNGKISVSSSQIEWALDDDHDKMLPIMQSDIMLEKDHKYLIIDAKYYSHNTQKKYDNDKIISGNLYQIFTYVKNKEALLANLPHKVSGMLLYASTDVPLQPNEDYQMSGNKISVRTLDLNREFSGISEQLNKIAIDYFF